MTVNSTTSELVQDNSDELIFGQKHNDIDCALCPTSKLACDPALFMEALVEEQLTNICKAYPDREQWRTNASGVRMFPKWACDILDKMYDEDDTFLSEYRIE